MKVTVGSIINSQQTIAKLLDLKLPATTAFRLSRIISKVESELKLFEEHRVKLVKEFGFEEDGQYKIKPENVEVFNKEMEAILSVEIDLTVEQISISEFGDVEISARDLIAIEWLVKE